MTDHRRGRLLGLPLDPLTMRETADVVERHIATGQPGAHAGLNAANVMTAHADAVYARDLDAADIVSPDGQSVVWAGRLLGAAVPERVTGIDLMVELLKRARMHDWPVYLIGARADVVAELARRISMNGIAVAGFRDGYFGIDQDREVAAAVRASGAQLLFIGMPSPRKERFIIGAAREAGIPFSIGVGGSFDVLAGRLRRAPRWAQQLGLEWTYRLAQEPRRLLRRYAITNIRFIGLVASELWRARSGRR